MEWTLKSGRRMQKSQKKIWQKSRQETQGMRRIQSIITTLEGKKLGAKKCRQSLQAEHDPY
jgi:hypothetical protein